MKEKFKGKLLYIVSISFIIISIGLALALSFVARDSRVDERRDTVEAVFIEQQRIPYSDISFIREVNSNFHEIHLDNGDVYTVRRNSRNEYVISKIEGVVQSSDRD